MKEKQKRNSRVLGLVRMMLGSKKHLGAGGISIGLGTISSIVGYFLTKETNIIFASLSISFLLAILYILYVEYRIVRIMVRYLKGIQKDYITKIEKKNLIDREIKVFFPSTHLWNGSERRIEDVHINALYWLEHHSKKNTHVLIEGQMGIGKTVLSLSIANHLAEKVKKRIKSILFKKLSSLKIPIYIPLSRSEYFPDKYHVSEEVIRGNYREWLVDVINISLGLNQEKKELLLFYLEKMFIDLSSFYLIFDGFDEFEYKEKRGKLSPESLFKHTTDVWQGPLLITSRPYVLSDLKKEFNLKSTRSHHSLEYTNILLRDMTYKFDTFKNPFAFGELSLFDDITAWRYLQGRPLGENMPEEFFKNTLMRKLQYDFGKDWLIPLYLWSISSYSKLEEIPKTQKELLDSIFELHFGWYYCKKELGYDAKEKELKEENYRDYTKITGLKKFRINEKRITLRPSSFFLWQKEILAKIAFYLINEEKKAISVIKLDEISKEKTELVFSQSDREKYLEYLKESIREKTYILHPLFEVKQDVDTTKTIEHFIFSPWRLKESFAANAISRLDNKSYVNFIKTRLKKFEENREIILMSLDHIDDNAKIKKLIDSTFPQNLSKLIEQINVQLELPYSRILRYVKLNSELEAVELILNNRDIDKIDLTFLKYCKKLIKLDLSENQIIEKIDLSPLKNCIELEEVYLNNNQFTELDLDVFKHCNKIKSLNLASNQLSKLENLSSLEKCLNIRFLSLSYNLFSKLDLSELSRCYSFRHIDLSNNKLTSLDLSPLENCMYLENLNLGVNLLKEINLSFLHRPLVELYLHNNLLTNLNLFDFNIDHSFDKRSIIWIHKNPISKLDISPWILYPYLIRIDNRTKIHCERSIYKILQKYRKQSREQPGKFKFSFLDVLLLGIDLLFYLLSYPLIFLKYPNRQEGPLIFLIFLEILKYLKRRERGLKIEKDSISCYIRFLRRREINLFKNNSDKHVKSLVYFVDEIGIMKPKTIVKVVDDFYLPTLLELLKDKKDISNEDREKKRIQRMNLYILYAKAVKNDEVLSVLRSKGHLNFELLNSYILYVKALNKAVKNDEVLSLKRSIENLNLELLELELQILPGRPPDSFIQILEKLERKISKKTNNQKMR